jgi:transcriptional regulator with XRE-family HTH domain
MGKLSGFLYQSRVMQRRTLREVATKIGISAMYLSELENGVKIPLRSNVLPKLAEEYGITNDAIQTMAEEEQMEQAMNSAKAGDFQKAFTAARKSPDITYALSEFIKSGGN